MKSKAQKHKTNFTPCQKAKITEFTENCTYFLRNINGEFCKLNRNKCTREECKKIQDEITSQIIDRTWNYNPFYNN